MGPFSGPPIPQFAPPIRVIFEYRGRLPMIVIGPVSGRRYRFGSGDRVEVDPRDRRSLASVPTLNQVV